MNKREKEIIQAQLNNEKAVLKQLEEMYKEALLEINDKIAILLGRQDADLQHVIYQVQYQQALKTQVQAILENLQANEFETISEYLANSYEEGFLGTMYDLQGQGIPLVFPIDQEQVVQAIQTETKLSTTLYAALDMKDLQKKISGEISRGIAGGQMYTEIARNIAGYARIPKNNAMRIVRTEANRIQNQAISDAQFKAKSKGADIVKIWSAALDKRTRDSHARVDGEIRELEEPFSNGLMKPSDPDGRAEEVINCRCRCNSKARWLLDEPITKWSPDAPVEISDDGTTQYFKIDAKDYQDFKNQYRQATERVRLNAQKMKGQNVLENNGKNGTIKSLDMDDFDVLAYGKGMNQESLDTFKEVIKEYEKKGGMHISQVHFGEFYDNETGKEALFQVFVNHNGLTEMNVNSKWLSLSPKALDEKIASVKANTPKNLKEAIIHECGHAKAYYKKSAKEVEKMNKDIKEKGVEGISLDAKRDGAECIAEVEVLLYRGEDVPEDAMKLYRKYVKG